MTTIALYARYSSDNQDEKSIEDQLRDCETRASDVQGLITERYTDYAISGSTVLLRPGVKALLRDASEGKFDVVMAEALDRISRDQEDVAAIYKRLKFHGVKLITTSEGEINELHIGFKGTMNAIFLKDLADKTRRGQRGSVANGLIPGGITFGYKKVQRFDARGEPVRGEREIDHEQAEIVKRIFLEYIAGHSPRMIAKGLNMEGIPSPRGGSWNTSTINGNKTRRNGILHNELYIGRIVYNRQRFIKDPETGKRVARSNPREEWTIKEVPELQIINKELWDKAQSVRKRYTGHEKKPFDHRRPQKLFSGMLKCGKCGGPMIIIGQERYGCSHRRERGSCDNAHSIRVQPLETRVLEGIRKELVRPDVVNTFIKEFHAEMKRARAKQITHRKILERSLADTQKKIDGIMASIMDGMYHASLKEKMTELEQAKAKLEGQLDELRQSNIIEIHPNLGEAYARKIDQLIESLNSDEAVRLQATAVLRTLIEKITLHPGKKKGQVDIEIHGEMAAILHFAQGDSVPLETTMTKVVVIGAPVAGDSPIIAISMDYTNFNVN